MKLRILPVLALLLLVASPTFAQKIYIDYDPDYDRSQAKTFAWKDTPKTSLEEKDPLTHSRIVAGLEHYFTQSGAVEVEEDPDVYVTYHASAKKELSINTSDLGYGYPSGWYRHPYWGGSYAGSSTTTVSEYTKGTLVVDVWDARTGSLVWRGTAAGIYVPENPQKLAKKIDKALKKMSAKWQKVKAQEAKEE